MLQCQYRNQLLLHSFPSAAALPLMLLWDIFVPEAKQISISTACIIKIIWCLLVVALSPSGSECGIILKAQGNAPYLNLVSHSICLWNICGIRESLAWYSLRKARIPYMWIYMGMEYMWIRWEWKCVIGLSQDPCDMKTAEKAFFSKPRILNLQKILQENCVVGQKKT